MLVLRFTIVLTPVLGASLNATEMAFKTALCGACLC